MRKGKKSHLKREESFDSFEMSTIDIESQIGIHIPQDICWNIMMCLDLPNLLKHVRINKTFHSVTKNEMFWKEYALNLGLTKFSNEESWKMTIEKFFLTSSLIYLDPIRKEFSMSLYIIGASKSGKVDLVRSYFGLTFNNKELHRLDRSGAKLFFSTQIGSNTNQKNVNLNITFMESLFEEIDKKTLQDKFHKIIGRFLKSGLFLLCFDLSSQESFDALTLLKNKLKNYPYRGMKIVLVGLKSDLEQKVKDEDIADLSKALSTICIKCSSKKNIDVKKAFEYLIKKNLVGWEFQRKRNIQNEKTTKKDNEKTKEKCIIS